MPIHYTKNTESTSSPKSSNAGARQKPGAGETQLYSQSKKETAMKKNHPPTKLQAINELCSRLGPLIRQVARKYSVDSAQLGDALIIALVAASLHEDWRDFLGPGDKPN